MKKTLIAMAAVAVAGVASAQVTITGAIGAGISDTSAANRSIGWTDSKFTLAASEDLGGGMSAAVSMTIESYGDGAASTNVNAGGATLDVNTANAGSLSIFSTGAAAHDLAVGSMSYGTNDVLGGTTNDYTAIQYNLPTLVDGLSIGVRWAGADTVSPSAVDKQFRFGYNLAGAALTFNTKSTSTGTASTAGLSYDLAGATLKVVTDTSAQVGSNKKTEYSISMPVGAVTVAASNMTKGDLKATEATAKIALSKRTTVQASIGTFSGTGITTTSANRVKIVHSF